MLAAGCALLGAAAVLAPVVAVDPVLTWPAAGREPTDTVLPLSPYRPLELDATVPCAAVAAVGPGGEALRTLPADAPLAGGTELSPGLVVGNDDGALVVVVSGVEVLRTPLPGAGCTVGIHAGAGPGGGVPAAPGVQVSLDGTEVASRPDVLAPQVAELTTAATGAAAAGLGVVLHTDARFQSSPSPLKSALLVAHLVTLLSVLALAAAWLRRPRSRDPAAPGARWRPRLPDAVVVVVALLWTVLSPVNADDSWYLTMARASQASGYVGNQVYMLNVTENPFATSQYAMAVWGAVGGWGLAWQRLLPLAYGLLAYAALRGAVGVTLGRVAGTRAGRWAVALAFGLWWLPYGMTLRPEPLIVLGSAVVLLLGELARRDRAAGPLVVAVAVAVLTLTVSPSGLVAVAGLAPCTGWLLRAARDRVRAGRAGAGAAVAGVLAAGAATTAVVPVGFWDASLGDVRTATDVHSWYYTQYRWFQEVVHFQLLSEQPWARQVPVYLTIAVLVVLAVGLDRARRGIVARALAGYGLVAVVALLALTATPTKLVNHFGAVGAAGTALLAVALLRSPLARRSRAAVVALGTAVVVLATSASFAGNNLWVPYSQWGQLFVDPATDRTLTSPYNSAPRLGPVPLQSPLLWLAVAAAAWWWVRRRRRGPGPDTAVLRAAAVVAVVLLVVSFVVAPLRRTPTVASTVLAAATGQECGFGPEVDLQVDGRTRTASEVLAGQPTLVDQLSASLWPCVEQVVVVNGVAQLPRYRVRVGDGTEADTAGIPYDERSGGVYAMALPLSTATELPSALDPPTVSRLAWGHVDRLDYPYPVGLVDTTTGTVVRPGWARLAPLSGAGYAGNLGPG